MRLSRFVVTAVAISITVFLPANTWAACQSLAGSWDDLNGEFTWSLSQSGSSFSGTVNTPGCEGDGIYTISGTVNSSAGITLYGSATETTGCPATSFTYTGTLTGAGCDQAGGTWTNSLSDNGNWGIYKSCDAPDSETTTTTGGSFGSYPADKSYQFQVTLQSSSGLLFGGRTIQESDGGGGADYCYASWSIYDPTNTVPTGTANVSVSQGYADTVGYLSYAAAYYQSQRPAHSLSLPCGFVKNQKIGISCDGPTYTTYQTNQLSSCVTSSAQVDCRPGYCYTNTGTCISTTLP